MAGVRNSRILKSVDLKHGIGLEIGPLTAPVVSKKQGKVYYLDHMSQEDLKEKYKHEQVNPDEIMPVDFILKDNSLRKSVRGKKFDYIVASHVIEHIPDMVAWLKDAASILKTGGVLSLVIPDKRFTFDIERQVSEPADIIGAYLDKTTKFTSASMYDFAVRYADNIDTASAWSSGNYYTDNPPKHRWTREEAYEMCLENLKPGSYVDSHCYAFTPAAFRDILKELTELDLLGYELSYFLETQEGELEFYVSLKKINLKTADKKLLLRKIRSVNISPTEDSLTRQNKALRKELHDITQSQSWKLTRPLRAINKIRK